MRAQCAAADGEPPQRRLGRHAAPAPSLRSREAPQPFGRYQLLARLGRGGMAEVCLALATGPSGFRKVVVVKRLHQHLIDEPEMAQLFLDEARLSARMNHQNVVQTYEVGSVAERPYIAMEYLSGVSLDEIMKRARAGGRPLPPAVAARIVADLLEGLHYAHQLGDFDGTSLDVVHRDVSPQNILLCWDGNVKLIDFGIAQSRTHVAPSPSGVVRGKAAYLAPEQAAGNAVDVRADIWSAGVVLWEALAGRSLFQSVNDAATLCETLSAPIPPLRKIAPLVPADLDRIVARALSRDIQGRYPSAAQMAADLRAWLRTCEEEPGQNEVAWVLADLARDLYEAQQEVIARCLGSDRVQTVFDDVDANLPRTLTEHEPPGPLEPPLRRRGAAPWWAATAVFAGTASVLVALADPALANELLGVFAARRVDALAVVLPEPSAPSGSEAAPPRSPSSEHGSADPLADLPATGEAPAFVEPIALVAVPPAGAAAPRGHGRSRRAAVADDPAADQDAKETAEYGFLSLDTTPWAQVSLGEDLLGTTPLLSVRLPVGTHVLSLYNPDRGIHQQYSVTVRAGATTARRLGLD